MKNQTETSIGPNLEAETSIIAAILGDNSLWYEVADILKPQYFGEPLCAALFVAAGEMISQGLSSTHVSIRGRIETHPTYKEAGGEEFLFGLSQIKVKKEDVRSLGLAISENHAKRSLLLLAENVTHLVTNTPETISSIISKASVEINEIATYGGTSKKTLFSLGDSFELVTNQLNEKFMGVEDKLLLPSGIATLDDSIGGFYGGDMVVIAGRPSMGKTALALQLGLNMAMAGKRGRYFSIEMGHSQLTQRLLSCLVYDKCKVPYSTMRKHPLRQVELTEIFEASHEFKALPFDIEERSELNMATIEASLVRQKESVGLDWCAVDYLQLVKGSAKSKGDRSQEVSEISGQFKLLCKKLEIVGFGLSQLSRTVESRDNKRPTMSDLRDSGAIEQDADVILFPYRHEYYVSRALPGAKGDAMLKLQDELSDSKDKMELIVAKNRAGSTGAVEAFCDIRCNVVRTPPSYNAVQSEDEGALL